MSIEARFNLSKGDFRLNLSLELPGQGVTAIHGPSGSGKTTLLRALAGLEKNPGGLVKVGEHTWQDASVFLPTHKRAVGYVFQEPSLFSQLSVRDNMRYGQRRVPRALRRIEFAEVEEWLGITPLMNRPTSRLSGGERQRVAIARALLGSPSLLLMDEPLASLDSSSKQEILPYLERLHETLSLPIIYVSHSLEEVARLSDHLVQLEAGALRASGPMAALMTRLDLAQLHGEDAEAVIPARVTRHDPEFQLAYLEFPGGEFCVAHPELPVGRDSRLRVLARDVSLTLERQAGTSILNIFPARVEELLEESPGQVLVRLSLNESTLLSRVTLKSAQALELAPGVQVFAQVKAVALLD